MRWVSYSIAGAMISPPLRIGGIRTMIQETSPITTGRDALLRRPRGPMVRIRSRARKGRRKTSAEIMGRSATKSFGTPSVRSSAVVTTAALGTEGD